MLFITYIVLTLFALCVDYFRPWNTMYMSICQGRGFSSAFKNVLSMEFSNGSVLCNMTIAPSSPRWRLPFHKLSPGLDFTKHQDSSMSTDELLLLLPYNVVICDVTSTFAIAIRINLFNSFWKRARYGVVKICKPST